MTSDLARSYRLRDHLGMYWLRPECALWDAIAAYHLQPRLAGRRNILELGIGNGYFSFLMLGGAFSPEFDWFRNIDVEGFWSNADVFDSTATVDPAQYITQRPADRIRYGVDHKRTLLAQAARLGLVDELICHDGNEPIELAGVDTVYSNILYWLEDPLGVLEHLERLLPGQGGRMVLVFPNSDFYAACRSYARESALWRLINRGRADHIMWSMDAEPFAEQVAARTNLRVVETLRYMSPQSLMLWDIGMRPLLPLLVRMTSRLTLADRCAIKQEWIDTAEAFVVEVLAHEVETGPGSGGFNLVVLENRA